MKVAWVGSYEPGFSRNQRLAQYMDAADIEVRQARINLWPPDRVRAFQTGKLSLLVRMAWSYPLLVLKLLFSPRPDMYLVSYPGWFDVPIVKLVAWLKRRPVVFDIFISLHDTAISDRALARTDSLMARLSLWIDRLSMRSADRIIADCPTHADFLAAQAGIKRDRFGVVYVGADDRVFSLQPQKRDWGRHVLFYGSYVPLQGVETIVRAAHLMDRQQSTTFKLIGAGQDRELVETVARSGGASDLVEFLEPVPLSALPAYLSQCDLALGIFGKSEKAQRVIPHKVFEALASGRPVLTGATTAVLEVFRPDQVATCPIGDPGSLAASIDQLLGDPDRLRALAVEGRRIYEERFSTAPQAERLKTELGSVLSR